MMDAQMTGNAAQIHPIHIQLQGFLAHLLWVGPRLGLRGVFDLAEHAAITLTATAGFSGSVLAFGSVTFWTFDHILIIAHFLATSGNGIISPMGLIRTDGALWGLSTNESP